VKLKRRGKIRKTKKAKAGRLIGYARVSTEDQRLDLQQAALKKLGCAKIFTEKLSGAAKKRPQLDAAIAALRSGDTLVVWRFDRLSRDVLDQHRRLAQLRDKNSLLMSLSETIDITTAAGRLQLGIIGLFAQYERETTGERTRAGMRTAMEKGQRFGPPFKIKRRVARAIRKLRRRDGSWAIAGGVRAVAAKFKLSQGSVHNCLSRPLSDFPA
jgi:DNA invertase Pin-like site-specific DNA recombinase